MFEDTSSCFVQQNFLCCAQLLSRTIRRPSGKDHGDSPSLLQAQGQPFVSEGDRYIGCLPSHLSETNTENSSSQWRRQVNTRLCTFGIDDPLFASVISPVLNPRFLVFIPRSFTYKIALVINQLVMNDPYIIDALSLTRTRHLHIFLSFTCLISCTQFHHALKKPPDLDRIRTQKAAQ
jgi:hypothetical protein